MKTQMKTQFPTKMFVSTIHFIVAPVAAGYRFHKRIGMLSASMTRSIVEGLQSGSSDYSSPPIIK